MVSNQKKRARWVALALAALLVLPPMGALCAAAAPATPVATPRPTYDPKKPHILQNLFLYGDSGVVMEQHSGRVLFDMRGDKRQQPASITKIITLLLALEHGNLKDKVTVGKEIRDIPGDSSRVPLVEGETLTLEELCYGLMIQSGNDAAMVLAVHTAGSVDAFVDMMNERAAELGCQNTHFANPHGYEHKDHYTTAVDMAYIARECMQNEEFRTIVNTPSFVIKKNNKRKNNTTLYSKNQFVGNGDSMVHRYADGTGIKTGYFSAAKHTFVGSASRDGVDLISVILKTTKDGKWIDGKRLMEYGFSVCQPYSLLELYEKDPVYVDIEGGEDNARLELKLFGDPKTFMLADTPQNIKKIRSHFDAYCSIDVESDLSAPIEEGMLIGTLTFCPEGGQPSQYQLVAGHDVAAYTPPPQQPSTLAGMGVPAVFAGLEVLTTLSMGMLLKRF